MYMQWNGYYEVKHNAHFIVSELWIYVFLQELQLIQCTTNFEHYYTSQFKKNREEENVIIFPFSNGTKNGFGLTYLISDEEAKFG